MGFLSFDQKLAGLLVPVFALRRANDFGIGDTLAVREAIDFCAEQQLGVLQLLPIHETIGDHSPYNAISSRALSPALLTITEPEVPGLTRAMLESAAPESWLAQLRGDQVKHNSVQPLKLQLLLAAHRAFRSGVGADRPLAREFAAFQEHNADWLPAYTLFRVLVREYEGNPNPSEWRPDHQTLPTAEAWLSRHEDRARLSELREGFAFIQWVACRQWLAVREHADRRGVLLMGEMSFGVGRCSVDVWAHPELFESDWSLGTRPIAYFDTNKDSERWGQNWGLPPYRWENHRSTRFAWLRARIEAEKEFFHLCRLDHLRGYFRAYMFPWNGGAEHTEYAKLTEAEARERTGGRMPRFVPGPDEDPVSVKMNDLQGREIISVLQDAAGDMVLIAEIMGAMPEYMRQALEDLQMPNLTFPQLERNADRSLQPKDSFRRLSLASYANHDHAPLAALYLHLHEQAKQNPDGTAAIDLRNLLAFAGWREPPPPTLTSELLAALQRALFETPCFLTVLLSSDLFGTAQRFNLPGSYGAGTWCERLESPIGEYVRHPVYGPRLATVRRLIEETGRMPERRRESAPSHTEAEPVAVAAEGTT
jgi:4-alpha-glucanotransferase